MDYERGWTLFREGTDVARSPDNEHTIVTEGCCFAGLDLQHTHPNSGHTSIQDMLVSPEIQSGDNGIHGALLGGGIPPVIAGVPLVHDFSNAERVFKTVGIN